MFTDREEAGKRLADAVAAAKPERPVVLALPRGGVPLGAAMAERLKAPLDLVMVRKIGTPRHAELAAGAIVDGPVTALHWNPAVMRHAGVTEADFDGQIARLKEEISQRRQRYLGDHVPVDLRGRTAILVDDGLATGATMRVAAKAVAQMGAKSVWAAVPVGPSDTVDALAAETDRVICLEVPEPFLAVGAHYRNFAQVEDAEVVRLMDAAQARSALPDDGTEKGK